MVEQADAATFHTTFVTKTSNLACMTQMYILGTCLAAMWLQVYKRQMNVLIQIGELIVVDPNSLNGWFELLLSK